LPCWLFNFSDPQKAFPSLIHRFGEDLLEEAILITHKKIKSYDLYYRDKKGNPNPVKFVSYIWKRIDGFIIDYLKKEINEPNRIKHQLLQELTVESF